MAMRISELYGIDIFSERAEYIGKVNDIILNLEKGEIIRLTTEPLRSVSKEKAKEILKDKSVLYRNVKAVGDIMIVGKGKKSEPSKEEIEVENEAGRSKKSLLGRIK
jgi:sporulation protein YlmC with PRC-barrel domain